MPALVIPQGVIVRLVWSQSTVDTAVNVLGALNPTSLAITQTLTNTIGSAVKSALGSSGLNGVLSSTVALRAVGLRDISVPNQAEFLDGGGPTAGVATGDLLPSNVAYCVTLRTSLAGRSFRGRYYQWGYTETVNGVGGVPLAIVQTDTVAFVTAVGNALQANGLTPAVLSRKLLSGTAWSAPTGRTLLWTTQRRRLIPGI